MIREWLSSYRRHRAAKAGERAWKRDRRRHPDERIALRDEQIAGLRAELAAAQQREAQLQVALAAAVMGAGLERHFADGRRAAERRLNGDTVVISGDAFQATRPAGPAPATEQWPR